MAGLTVGGAASATTGSQEHAASCPLFGQPLLQRVEESAAGICVSARQLEPAHEIAVPFLQHRQHQPVARAEVLVERSGRGSGGSKDAIDADASKTLGLERASRPCDHVVALVHTHECKAIVLHCKGPIRVSSSVR